ncbi:hypothetical protein CEXT_729261 [Caerostris extrusa]|uniref:Uncharacterized protein n=1 Tax=Caerostris extrusa TaxID=172846 RepID=A0AAV4UCQ3_CAEEX|nr:hypothetical protein CEXT_729261 [Caerostris extrusa]
MFCLMVLHLAFINLLHELGPATISFPGAGCRNVSNLTEFVVSGSLNTHPEAESRNLTGVIRTYTLQSTPSVSNEAPLPKINST